MKKLLILTVAALSAVSVMAQEEALVAQILKNNPDLEVARLNKEADSLSARSENNLADPEVEVEYMSKAGTMEMTVKESFEWPGAYMARRKAIEHNISAFEYLYESQKIEAVKQARLAYLDLVRLNRSIKRQGKILAMIEKIVNNTALLEVRDEMTVITIGKLRIEAFDLASQIRQMKIERNVVLESLRIMNGGKPVEIDTETCEFNAELKDRAHYADAYAQSPDNQAVMQKNLAMQKNLSVAKQGYLPGFSLGYKFVKEDEPLHGFMVGVSIPLFSNRHKVKAAKAYRMAAELEYETTKLQLGLQVESLYGEVESLGQAIKEFEGIVNDTNVRNSLEKSYAERSISLIDYLAEYRFFLEAEARLDEMKYQYSQKFIELSKYDSFLAE